MPQLALHVEPTRHWQRSNVPKIRGPQLMLSACMPDACLSLHMQTQLAHEVAYKLMLCWQLPAVSLEVCPSKLFPPEHKLKQTYCHHSEMAGDAVSDEPTCWDGVPLTSTRLPGKKCMHTCSAGTSTGTSSVPSSASNT